MQISLDIKKSVEENAQAFFEKAKKARKKVEGAREALILHEQKLAAFDAQAEKEEEKKTVKKKEENVDRQWYEKFRWFISSEHILCISGTDATTNEIVVKKHMRDHDVVLHTEMSGSPFTIVQVEKEEPTQITLDEAAQFTMCYSKAWKMGMGGIPVFHVKPEQVSKTPNSGEYVAKGSFIIRGKTTHLQPIMEICVGVAKDGTHKGRIIAGTKSVMEAHARIYAVLRQGGGKSSRLAKDLMKKFEISGQHNLDDLIKYIPSGGAELVTTKKLKV